MEEQQNVQYSCRHTGRLRLLPSLVLYVLVVFSLTVIRISLTGKILVEKLLLVKPRIKTETAVFMIKIKNQPKSVCPPKLQEYYRCHFSLFLAGLRGD